MIGGSHGVSAEWHLMNASSFPGQRLATSDVRQAPENHYYLLVRCWRTDVSETIRWMHTSYSVRFNEAHRWQDHVFQGRFKSVLIRTEVKDPAKAGQVVVAAGGSGREDAGCEARIPLARGEAVLATGRGARVTEGARGADLGKTS